MGEQILAQISQPVLLLFCPNASRCWDPPGPAPPPPSACTALPQGHLPVSSPRATSHLPERTPRLPPEVNYFQKDIWKLSSALSNVFPLANLITLFFKCECTFKMCSLGSLSFYYPPDIFPLLLFFVGTPAYRSPADFRAGTCVL